MTRVNFEFTLFGALCRCAHVFVLCVLQGIYDRLVVQNIIKEIAQNNPLHQGTGAKSFKVVLLMEVDRLTRQVNHPTPNP